MIMSIFIALNILKLKLCSSTSEHNKVVLAMIIKDDSCVPDCKFNLHCIIGKLYLVTIVITYAFPVWSRTIFKIFLCVISECPLLFCVFNFCSCH